MNEHSGLDVTLNELVLPPGASTLEFFYRHGAGPHRERFPGRWPSACKTCGWMCNGRGRRAPRPEWPGRTQRLQAR